MKLNQILPWSKDGHQLARTREEGDPFNLLHRRINHLFDDFFGSQLSNPWNANRVDFAPRIDLSESGGDVRISAELPGLDDKDVEVTLVDNMLTLRGEKKAEHEENHEGYYHCERSYGSFERTVQLPDNVDTDKAVAKFKKGVLQITIPMKPGSKASRRKIELQTD